MEVPEDDDLGARKLLLHHAEEELEPVILVVRGDVVILQRVRLMAMLQADRASAQLKKLTGSQTISKLGRIHVSGDGCDRRNARESVQNGKACDVPGVKNVVGALQTLEQTLGEFVNGSGRMGVRQESDSHESQASPL